MTKKYYLLFLVPLTLALIGGGVYKWVDERGVTHYSSNPPPNQKSQELKIQPSSPPSSGSPTSKSSQQLEEEWKLKKSLRESEQKEKEQAALSDENARKLLKLQQEYGPLWKVGLDLEQQCQEKYGLSCDALLNWKEQAIKDCRSLRDVDCGDENYLRKFKPISIDEQEAERQGAIQMRARERAYQRRSIGH
jgi:hypothetical protein